jgi:hypothetical protein
MSRTIESKLMSVCLPSRTLFYKRFDLGMITARKIGNWITIRQTFTIVACCNVFTTTPGYGSEGLTAFLTFHFNYLKSADLLALEAEVVHRILFYKSVQSRLIDIEKERS